MQAFFILRVVVAAILTYVTFDDVTRFLEATFGNAFVVRLISSPGGGDQAIWPLIYAFACWTAVNWLANQLEFFIWPAPSRASTADAFFGNGANSVKSHKMIVGTSGAGASLRKLHARRVDGLESRSSESADPSLLDAGEVDPVAEADVYAAYGRYQQALEILEEVLAKEPTHERALAMRDEIRNKQGLSA